MEHRIPPLRRHKRKGRKDQAYVSFDGKRTYFGGWGTPAVNAAYKQFVAQWEVDYVPVVSAINLIRHDGTGPRRNVPIRYGVTTARWPVPTSTPNTKSE